MGMIPRAYRQIDRLAPGRRSFRLLRPLWPLSTGAIRAAEATRPAGAAFTPSTRTAGPTAARTAPHPLDLCRELGQLIAVEFAIAIGIKLHRMLDEPLGRGWSARPAAARSATALTGARTASPLTGTAGTLALSDTTRTLKRATAIGRSLNSFGRLGDRHRYKGYGSHGRGHHHRDSRHASHHRLLGKRHWKPSVKRGKSARQRHLTQVRVAIFNGLRREKFRPAGHVLLSHT
jgi:hypothetical protein